MAAFAHGKNANPQLVIFGCGYVGSAVVASARARGIAVTALTRNAETAGRLATQGAKVIQADLATESWHDLVPAAPDWVLNCVSSGGGGDAGYRHSYVDGMGSIIRWAERCGPVGTIIYTSSTSVYPQGGGVVIDENASITTTEVQARPGILLETERKLMQSAGACDRWFVLRLAGIYGPQRHHLLDQTRTGVLAGRAEHRLNLAHRDDIVAAIFACFLAEPAVRNEIFNVADDRAAPKSEIVAWLAAQLGAPTPRFTGEPAARRAVTPDRVIANGKLRSLLGWRPEFPTFREGYADILRTAGS